MRSVADLTRVGAALRNAIVKQAGLLGGAVAAGKVVGEQVVKHPVRTGLLGLTGAASLGQAKTDIAKSKATFARAHTLTSQAPTVNP